MDWQPPPDWPVDVDARWRLAVLKDAATRIAAYGATCSVEEDGPASLWMSVRRDGQEVARVFANRSLENKAEWKFTLVAGASAVDCRSSSKLAFLAKQAREPLPAEGPALLPPSLRYLQPLAERGDRVGSQAAVEATLARLIPEERADLSALYRAIAARDDVAAIDRWTDEHPIDPVSGKVTNLLILLDGLARAGGVPEEVAGYRLVEWDGRTHDDHGNEW